MEAKTATTKPIEAPTETPPAPRALRRSQDTARPDRTRKRTSTTAKATRAKRSKRRRVEASCVMDGIQPLSDTLHRRVLGQDDVLEPLICSFGRMLSGLRDPSRPLLTGLLLGPTGVGKTETARAIAEGLLGSDSALVRIHCEEFAQGHEVAKLLGSPPGYVGHDIEALLSQSRIDAGHNKLLADEATESVPELLTKVVDATQGERVAVILFDEIEKAHPTVWNALLGLLEDGEVTLGNNTNTDFTRSIVLMTSNVGSAEIRELLEGQTLGFAAPQEDSPADDSALHRRAMAAAHQRFPAEFLNRFDEVLVYGSLQREDLRAILRKLLAELHQRALDAGTPFLLRLSEGSEALLLDEGTDPRFGARPLRRTVDRALIGPLSRLVAARQLTAGDVVDVEVEDERLAFFVDNRNDHQLIT